MSLYATEAMRALGSSFSTHADNLDQQTRPTLAGLGVVTTALRDTFDAIGTALHRVAGHHERVGDHAVGDVLRDTLRLVSRLTEGTPRP